MDTYVLSSSATTNFGTDLFLGVGEANNANNRIARGLIKFDLSSIPSNAVITSASLSLWTTTDLSDNDRTIRVYRLKTPFNEAQATWNQAATGINWQSPGASGANDRESADIGSVQILATEPLTTEKQISLSPAQIQEMVNGTFTNNGFIIVADTETNDRFHYKSSDASNGAQRPKLVIQYTLTPTATPTPTPTVTPSPTATETPSATPAASNTPSPTATQTPPQGPVTITYDYDPLYRLTAADYSTGDYYHYSYDAVGNREIQETMIGGLLSTDSYNYDDANRLIDVDGVLYSWDDNGNLLSNGINTYTYDSANRLKTLTGPSVNANYTYNGLGDRLQETLNGNTTTFTMDLNMGLTQALSDGTNTYIYGIDRIAQVNTSTEYFLGDALSSVRQMAPDSGIITYARAYDPYGVVTTTSGSSQSAYGYTGEYTDSYIKLIYLRSRMYDPLTGRFTTKDSWQGDYNRPLSLNRWNYVHSNPVNYLDPSGKRRRCVFWAGWDQASIDKRVDAAEKIVSPNSDEINTYVAAAIAIQCAGGDEWWNNNSGIGPAQITDNQAVTEYGEVIPKRYWWGGIKYDENDKPIPRNFGLCPDGAILDPMDDQDSVILMRLLLQLTIDECKGCTSTDIYIASGLAQNGPGFNKLDMKFLRTLSDVDQKNLKIKMDWFGRFTTDLQRNNGINTKTQLERFTLVINELMSRGWYVPEDKIDFSWNTINSLRNWTVNSAIPTQVNP